MRYCVIMCGGVGSRFWPFSRENKPKQFLDFFGIGRSLLQLTVDRVRSLVPPENIILVTGQDYVPLVREQLPDILPENILAEPARRNTAPCICWAAKHIAARDPRATIVTLPSDHLILKEIAFIDALKAGMDFVESHDALLTLGIKPTCPHTGYGYIQQGHFCTDTPGIAKVKCFTEKPDLGMAKILLASGDFLWNAGIFLWRADTILEAFARYAPDVLDPLDAPPGVYGTPKETAFIDNSFPACPGISVDYAVMEKARNVYVMPVDLGWSDLGTWNALYEHSDKDAEGNVASGCKVVARDCSGTLFASTSDKVIAAIGLKDYIVADNGDTLLIAPLSAEQQVRTLTGDIADRFGPSYI